MNNKCEHRFNNKNHYIKCDSCKEEFTLSAILQQLQIELGNAKKEIAELKAGSEWFNFKDQYPKDGQCINVQVTTESKAIYHKDSNVCIHEGDSYISSDRWKPITKPTEQGE